MSVKQPASHLGLGRIDLTREEIEALVRRGRIMRSRAIAALFAAMARSLGRALAAAVAAIRHPAGPGHCEDLAKRSQP